MAAREIDVSISKDGQVKIHVSGVKGPACMEYAKLFERVVGPIEDVDYTREYYEEASEEIVIDIGE